MNPPPYICLPYLHPQRKPRAPEVRHLSPGHGFESPSTWTPPDYPFPPAQVRDILAQMRKRQGADLEVMRLYLTEQPIGEMARRQGEMADLASFTGAAPCPSSWDLVRQHAHQMILWLWHLEEQLDELKALRRQCAQAEAILAHNFGEDDVAPLPRAEESSTDPMPHPWRVCVAQAAIFLPPGVGIVMEGPMREEVAEHLELRPVPGGLQGLEGVHAPLWQVLGHSRPWGDAYLEPLNTVYNEHRLWCVLP